VIDSQVQKISVFLKILIQFTITWTAICWFIWCWHFRKSYSASIDIL